MSWGEWRCLGSLLANQVLWDSSDILFLDYLEKGKTINSDYYCALLNRLKEEITRKRPHLLKKKCIFLQDDAPTNKLLKTMAKINELRFELLPHPPYSPVVAPSDFVLKPKEMAPGTEIFIKWRGQMGNQWLFWRPWQIVLQKRHRNIDRSLD